MTKYEIRTATIDDVKHIASNLREADKAECLAGSGMHPSYTLGFSFGFSSDCRVGTVDDVPVCIFGVCETEPEEARIWMMGTPEVEKHATRFLRENKAVLDGYNDKYKKLTNHVDARNTKHIRWLKWLGFDIFEAVPWGKYNMPFHPFERVRE